MRKAFTTLVAIAALVLVVKVVATPGKTAADPQASPIQNAMSVYDLHIGYPNMKTLRADQTPSP